MVLSYELILGATRVSKGVVKSARDPSNPPQPFPVPFRPSASACGARFFSFFTANTTERSPFFTPPRRGLHVDFAHADLSLWAVRGYMYTLASLGCKAYSVRK
jgi:hypothetical protein